MMTTTTTTTAAATPARRNVFVATIFVGSFLLFMVQPMVARMALPRLGGAPAVWNSAMLVYQTLLLGGYAYAHWLGRFSVQRQTQIHLALLAVAALWLPVGLADLAAPAAGQESLWVPLLLAASIGPVFFAVSAQAPLVQRWYAAGGGGGDPYALYAASNLGSFSGLLAYPLLVEPLLPVGVQSWGWALGYGLLAALVVAVAAARWHAGSAAVVPDAAVAAAPAGPRPGVRRMLLWLALAAVPSGLMLSTTTHLTTDIVAMPLMWVIPLGLYLLSFVFAFGNWPRTTATLVTIAPACLLIIGGLSLLGGGNVALMVAAASLVMLFVVAVALHARLYDDRPDPAHLTLFYLVMSAGGAVGGLFAALIAPLLFDWVYEHPLLVVAAALLLPLPALIPWAEWLNRGALVARWVVIALVAAAGAALLPVAQDWSASGVQMALVGGGVLVGLLVIPWRWAYVAVVALLMFTVGGVDTLTKSLSGDRTRSYFGVYEVGDAPTLGRRMLTHGTTLHGMQLTAPDRRRTPTTYYGPGTGIGAALSAAPTLFGANASIGIVGLGTGTLACYAKPGQSWDFYEIDPAMVAIARDTSRFTFIADCTPSARMLVGDARIELARQAAARYDILAIDAFSSDAIPLHLLTAEAFDVYARSLRPGGVLAVHISNRYFDLEPVLAAEAKRRGWRAAIRFFSPDDAAVARGENGSTWVVFSADPARLAAISGPLAPRGTDDRPDGWYPPRAQPGFAGWTDDFSSIQPVVRWDWIF